MTKKTFIGLYNTDADLLAAIEELEAKGIPPEHMYVIAQNEEDVELLRRRTSEEIQSTPSNWLDRFIGYISGENHVRSMLVEVGFDEADLRRYEAEIKQGKSLLYVNGEPEKSAYEINSERQKKETNPFHAPISEAERLNKQDDESPVGIGPDGLPKNEYRDSIVTDAYEGALEARNNLLFGKVGAEALYDRSEYEPSEPAPSSPSQIRGTPSGERGYLHRASLRHQEFDGVDTRGTYNIPDPKSFMESQMDRQDAIAETNEYAEPSPSTGSSGDNERKEPIIIDLRHIDKTEDLSGTWFQPKNRDRN